MIRYIFPVFSAIVITGLIGLIFILPTTKPSTDATPATTTTNNLLIQNVRIFKQGKFTEAQHIRVKHGLIAEIDKDLSANEKELVIDGEGKFLLPGLIDAHTHTYGEGLRGALRFGVSTQLDMFTMEALLEGNLEARTSLEKTDKSDLFSSGTLATVASGHGTQFGMSIDTIETLDEIPNWIMDRKTAGANYIKLVYMPHQNAMPSLDLETATAIIQASHAQNMQVLAHISSQQAAKEMIEANIDGLVHIFADSTVSDELLALAKEKGTFIIPTLAVIASVDNQKFNLELAEKKEVSHFLSGAQRGSLKASFGIQLPGYKYAIAKDNVTRFFNAGVPILAGSDAPNAGTAYGVSLHQEMALLVDAGLSPLQALSAASSKPASIFQLSGRGHIAEGQRADLLIVNASPEENIENTLQIERVFKNGFELVREPTVVTEARTIDSASLGNFDTPDLPTVDGFIWSPTDDKFVNGQSEVILTHIVTVENEGSLQVKGEVKAGFSYPWAGASVGDFIPPVDSRDISTFTHLVFKVKGDTGQYQVMAFAKDASGIPPTQTFKISDEWREVRLPLAGFSGLELTQFSGFSFVAGPQLGKFEFMLDNVRFD